MKVILVYSGGLDTTICIPLLKEEYGYNEIVTVTIDVGQPKEDIISAEERAKAVGTTHYTIDAKDEFAKNYCFKAIKANGDYQGYPISTSIARPLIAAKAVELGNQLNCTHFAHGCTGKGNDQFRIEYSIRALLPHATIHAPIREKNLTRKWEITYAHQKNLPIQQSIDKIWSIDENLWGRSIEGGKLEDPYYSPPEEIFSWTKSPLKTPSQPREVEIDFKEGLPITIDQKQFTPSHLIQTANQVAGEHGIGRIDIMEDRILGLKVRENYECPAAMLLISAHQALEALVLTKEERRFKTLVDFEWSQLAYAGLWFDPFKNDLESFIDETQKRVTGTVKIRLFNGYLQILGRKSPWALYSEELSSFDTTSFLQNDSTGMVKNFGIQSRMYFHLYKQAQAKYKNE